MERRKIVSKRRYLYAFLIGTAIFILGFAITYSVAYLEFQRISTLQGPTSYQIFQDKLQYTLFGKDICADDIPTEISKDLSFQGQIIGDLEEKFGKDNKDVLFRKKFYTLILAEHFEMIKTINQECGKSINTILFFYSNDKKDIEKSENIGNILGVLYEQNQDNLFIYSFDQNLDSEIIKSLKEKYSVQSSTLIIVNEKDTFTTIGNIRDIQSILMPKTTGNRNNSTQYLN